jgi:hypothetical protein
MIGMGKKAGDAKDVVANVERGFVDRGRYERFPHRVPERAPVT